MIRTVGEYVFFEDAAGETRALIQEATTGPIVLLFHRDGTLAGGLTFSPADDEACIAVVDQNGFARAGVKIQDGEAFLCTFDDDGQPVSARVVDQPLFARENLLASRN